MAVDTSPSWAIMNRLEDPLAAAHLAREATMRFLMLALEYQGEPELSLEERVALSARSPFDAERLAYDVVFGKRSRAALLQDCERQTSRHVSVLRMIETFRGARAADLVTSSVAAIRQ